jgi:hypothetical protein
MRSLLVLTFAGLGFIGNGSIAAAQDSCDKQFVVSQVDLSTTTPLSPKQLAAIKARLIGRCFGDQPLVNLLTKCGHASELWLFSLQRI